MGLLIKYLFLLFLFIFLQNTHGVLSPFEKKLNNGEKYISKRWQLINYNVDSFFSDEKYAVSKNESEINAYFLFLAKENHKSQIDGDFQFKFHLPKTTHNLKLVIEKDQNEISKSMKDTALESSDFSNDNAQKNKRYSAYLNYLIKDTKTFSSSFSAGLRIDMPLNPSLKINLRKLYTYKYASLELAQDFFLYRQEGFSEISSANLSRKWNEKFRSDFVNTLAWAHEDSRLKLRHSFSLYQILSEHKTLIYSIGANARFRPSYFYESYDSSITFQKNFAKDFMICSLTLGADFLKNRNFKMDQFILLKTDFYFN